MLSTPRLLQAYFSAGASLSTTGTEAACTPPTMGNSPIVWQFALLPSACQVNIWQDLWQTALLHGSNLSMQPVAHCAHG